MLNDQIIPLFRTLNCDTLARMRDLVPKERFLPLRHVVHYGKYQGGREYQ